MTEFSADSIDDKYDVLKICDKAKELAKSIGLEEERESRLEAIITEFTEMITKPRRTGSIKGITKNRVKM